MVSSEGNGLKNSVSLNVLYSLFGLVVDSVCPKGWRLPINGGGERFNLPD